MPKPFLNEYSRDESDDELEHAYISLSDYESSYVERQKPLAHEQSRGNVMKAPLVGNKSRHLKWERTHDLENAHDATAALVDSRANKNINYISISDSESSDEDILVEINKFQFMSGTARVHKITPEKENAPKSASLNIPSKRITAPSKEFSSSEPSSSEEEISVKVRSRIKKRRIAQSETDEEHTIPIAAENQLISNELNEIGENFLKIVDLAAQKEKCLQSDTIIPEISDDDDGDDVVVRGGGNNFHLNDKLYHISTYGKNQIFENNYIYKVNEKRTNIDSRARLINVVKICPAAHQESGSDVGGYSDDANSDDDTRESTSSTWEDSDSSSGENNPDPSGVFIPLQFRLFPFKLGWNTSSDEDDDPSMDPSICDSITSFESGAPDRRIVTRSISCSKKHQIS